MHPWVVVADDDLRALLVTIGREAGIDVVEVEPSLAEVQLAAGEMPQALLVERGALGPESSGFLARIPRVAIAAAVMSADVDDSGPGLVLPLPASLGDVERVLRWLAWNGPQVERSSSIDASSARPLSI